MRIPAIELKHLPRRGDTVVLLGEGAMDLLTCYYFDDEPADIADIAGVFGDCVATHEGRAVQWRAKVVDVVHRDTPDYLQHLIHGKTGVGCTEVWVTAPTNAVCPNCGTEVDR